MGRGGVGRGRERKETETEGRRREGAGGGEEKKERERERERKENDTSLLVFTRERNHRQRGRRRGGAGRTRVRVRVMMHTVAIALACSLARVHERVYLFMPRAHFGSRSRNSVTVRQSAAELRFTLLFSPPRGFSSFSPPPSLSLSLAFLVVRFSFRAGWRARCVSLAGDISDFQTANGDGGYGRTVRLFSVRWVFRLRQWAIRIRRTSGTASTASWPWTLIYLPSPRRHTCPLAGASLDCFPKLLWRLSYVRLARPVVADTSGLSPSAPPPSIANGRPAGADNPHDAREREPLSASSRRATNESSGGDSRTPVDVRHARARARAHSTMTMTTTTTRRRWRRRRKVARLLHARALDNRALTVEITADASYVCMACGVYSRAAFLRRTRKLKEERTIYRGRGGVTRGEGERGVTTEGKETGGEGERNWGLLGPRDDESRRCTPLHPLLSSAVLARRRTHTHTRARAHAHKEGHARTSGARHTQHARTHARTRVGGGGKGRGNAYTCV